MDDHWEQNINVWQCDRCHCTDASSFHMSDEGLFCSECRTALDSERKLDAMRRAALDRGFKLGV